jgi:iron complex transport system ATP-binding protein
VTLPGATPPALEADRITIQVADRSLVSRLDLRLATGTLTCILGRNGTGKTLTLHTLAGLRSCSSGRIRIHDQPLESLSRRMLALRRALLTQHTEDAFPSTVVEAALVGRQPHLGVWQWKNATDRRLVSECLAEVDLAGFEQREVATLSGGERRRVAIATALVQEADVFMLDEPTNHLDPHHQLDVMKLLRQRTRRGHTILMTLHEPGLATRFADSALLLFGDGTWEFGPAAEVLNADTLSRLYGMRLRELRWERGRTFVPED